MEHESLNPLSLDCDPYYPLGHLNITDKSLQEQRGRLSCMVFTDESGAASETPELGARVRPTRPGLPLWLAAWSTLVAWTRVFSVLSSERPSYLTWAIMAVAAPPG